MHILGYAFDPSNRAMQPYFQGDRPRLRGDAASVIAALHQAGGLVILSRILRAILLGLNA